MPIDLSKYPKNWKHIALEIKNKADWKCEQCDRPCRKPKQLWRDFVEELLGTDWYNETCDEMPDGSVKDRPQRFTLTVAHLDHDTENNDKSNLKALCSGCHLRYDVNLHARNARITRHRKRESSGQGVLLF